MSVYQNDLMKYVKLSVESIINQTYKVFYLYVQCDGPVRKEVDEYLSGLTDERVKILRREENKGLAHCLNDMLAIVKPQGYEFIARMDADDISMPDRFEKQITFLQQHPQIDCVGGAINEIDESGCNRGKIIRYPCGSDECRAFFAKRNPVAHPSVMFRRSYFEKVGWQYPTEFVRNEDTMLWYKGYLAGA